jgi:hypothetical protein
MTTAKDLIYRNAATFVTPENLVGRTFRIHNFYSVTFKRSDVVERDVSQCHCLGSDHVVSVKMTKENTIFHSQAQRLFLNLLPHHFYTWTLHRNGVVRFKGHGNMVQNILLSTMESPTLLDQYLNLDHAKQYGCFCLGIVMPNGDIARYNRWKSDCSYQYTMRISRKGDITHSNEQTSLLPSTWNYQTY